MMLQLIKFQDEDLEEVVSMWHESKHAAFNYVPIQQSHTLDDDRNYFRNVITHECDVWLAEGGGEIHVMLALKGELIEQLFVRLGKQGLGVGSALLNKAREISPSGLQAFTFQKNAQARGFYARHGFKSVSYGTSPPPENEPDVLYVWLPVTNP
jgi:GNAT superfamily N-acetyltransferase